MQEMNWNDYRFLLAVKRTGSMSAAAKRLSVDVTTVSRRIKYLQNHLETQLLERLADGSYQLTPIGLAAATKGERIEKELDEFQASVKGSDVRVMGKVRISAAPMIVNRFITPRAPAFLRQHPELELHFNSDLRNLSLSKRETDIAVRLARPQEGGSHVKVRRIGSLTHGIYAAKDTPPDQYAKLPWCGYNDDLVFLPQAVWLTKEVQRGHGEFSPIRAGDAEGVIESIATCQTRSALPIIIGDADPRLKRIDDEHTKPDFVREIWLMVHADLSNLVRYKVVGDWLTEMFSI